MYCASTILCSRATDANLSAEVPHADLLQPSTSLLAKNSAAALKSARASLVKVGSLVSPPPPETSGGGGTAPPPLPSLLPRPDLGEPPHAAAARRRIGIRFSVLFMASSSPSLRDSLGEHQ